MSFGIKVKDTYACDSWQGVAWLFEEERAMRYPTKSDAQEAAKYVAAGYIYEIVPLAINLEEAKAQIEFLRETLQEVQDTVNVKEIINITGVPIETACSNARSIALKAGRVAMMAIARLDIGVRPLPKDKTSELTVKIQSGEIT